MLEFMFKLFYVKIFSIMIVNTVVIRYCVIIIHIYLFLFIMFLNFNEIYTLNKWFVEKISNILRKPNYMTVIDRLSLI
jgi:hypothetical protein